MSKLDAKKNEILKRSKERRARIKICHFDGQQSFTTSLSSSESLELVSRISIESYFLETGVRASNRVDKSTFKIFIRDR